MFTKIIFDLLNQHIYVTLHAVKQTYIYNDMRWYLKVVKYTLRNALPGFNLEFYIYVYIKHLLKYNELVKILLLCTFFTFEPLGKNITLAKGIQSGQCTWCDIVTLFFPP